MVQRDAAARGSRRPYCNVPTGQRTGARGTPSCCLPNLLATRFGGLSILARFRAPLIPCCLLLASCAGAGVAGRHEGGRCVGVESATASTGPWSAGEKGGGTAWKGGWPGWRWQLCLNPSSKPETGPAGQMRQRWAPLGGRGRESSWLRRTRSQGHLLELLGSMQHATFPIPTWTPGPARLLSLLDDSAGLDAGPPHDHNDAVLNHVAVCAAQQAQRAQHGRAEQERQAGGACRHARG